METFTKLKELVDNPHYKVQRLKSLGDLVDDMIDVPIIDLINGFNKLPFCFTLQSCYGHFVYNGQKDTHNLEPLPVKGAIAKWSTGLPTSPFALRIVFWEESYLSL